MNILQEVIRNTKEYFAQAATETVTASAIVKNAIANNIEALTTNPKLKKVGNNQYIAFGNNDDVPEIIDALFEKSTTHGGIIRKKAKMIAGKRLVIMTNGKETKDVKWNAFYNNAGGYGVSLYQILLQASFYYSKGANALLVVETKIDKNETQQPILMRIYAGNRFRAAKPENGKVTKYVIRDVFKQQRSDVFSSEEEVVEVFNPSKKQEKFCVHIKNPLTTNTFYGVPNYISAFDFIESDFEFGRTIKNSARNGFAPRVIAAFIGRNMTDEQKSLEAQKFKDNFNGADSENVINLFVRREEDMPQFTKLDVQNLDKTIDVMAKLNDSKILTAHNITSPTLFGIMVAGKLGGTGDELYTAYEIFKATEILPDREIILNAFSLALSNTIYKDKEFSIEDIDLSFLIGKDPAVTSETAKEPTKTKEKV